MKKSLKKARLLAAITHLLYSIGIFIPTLIKKREVTHKHVKIHLIVVSKSYQYLAESFSE